MGELNGVIYILTDYNGCVNDDDTACAEITATYYRRSKNHGRKCKLTGYHPVTRKPIAWLSWYLPGDVVPTRWHTIQMIKVDPAYHRQGLATAIWREGQRVEPRIRHSPVRTYRGDLWAWSTGDPVPEMADMYADGPRPSHRCRMHFEADVRATWPPILDPSDPDYVDSAFDEESTLATWRQSNETDTLERVLDRTAG